MPLPVLSTTNDICKRKKKILEIQRHRVQLSPETWFTAGNFKCQIRNKNTENEDHAHTTHKRKYLKRSMRLVCQMTEYKKKKKKGFSFYLAWGKLPASVSQGIESR